MKYTEYPDAFSKVVLIMEREKDKKIKLEMKADSALSQRRAFYRFVEALRKAPASDLNARRLYKTANNLKISVSPAGATGAMRAELVIYYDPPKLRIEKAFGSPI